MVDIVDVVARMEVMRTKTRPAGIRRREKPVRPAATGLVLNYSSKLEDFIQTSARVERLPRDRLRAEFSSDGRAMRGRLELALRGIQVIQQALDAEPADNLAPFAPPASGNEAIEKAIRSSELLESQRFVQCLHWSRQALSKALQARRVFFLDARGSRYYPAFFADSRHERRHLEAVSRSLGDLPGTSKWLFFTTPKGSLAGLTPIEALDKGMLQSVKATAEQHALA